VRYTIKQTIETDIDTFWNKLFFDAEFNRSMFVDHLGFTLYKVLEERTDPDGTRHRRVECTPKVELPGPARKVFGDGFSYVEVGRFDPGTRRYTVQVLPKVAADKIKTSSEIWVEALGEKRCERVVSIDNSVKVFGIGTLLEGYVEQQTRDLYAKSAEFTNRWIREKGL
jgi:hypothetical protein